MTNNPDTQPMVTVTQADRDAAADFLKSDGHPFDRLWHPAVRRGERDGHILVQAFARHRTQQTARSAPVVSRENELTPEFRAMTALQKWETLTLQGLLGTDEPWIEHMRQTLREDAARSADGGREALRRADELIRSIQQTPGGQWVVVSDDDEKLVCEADAFVSKALAALTPPTDDPLQDGGLREALDRIEATIDAAERCMNASPFWDDNSRYAGKALLDYPRSQIAHERQALSRGKP